MVVNGFKNETFPLPPTEGISFEILILRQKFQRLSIALAQVKADNT